MPADLRSSINNVLVRLRLNSRGRPTNRRVDDAEIVDGVARLFDDPIRVVEPEPRMSGHFRLGVGAWSDDDPDPTADLDPLER